MAFQSYSFPYNPDRPMFTVQNGRATGTYQQGAKKFVGGFEDAYGQAEADIARGEAEGNRIRGFQGQAFSGGMGLLGGMEGNVGDVSGYQSGFRQQGLDFTQAFERDRAEAFDRIRADTESLVAGAGRGMARTRDSSMADIERNPNLTEAQKAQLRLTANQGYNEQKTNFTTQAYEGERAQFQQAASDWGNKRFQSQQMGAGSLQSAMGAAATAGGMRAQGAGAYGGLGSAMQVVPVTSYMDTQAGAMSLDNQSGMQLSGIRMGPKSKGGFMSKGRGTNPQSAFAQNQSYFAGRNAKNVNPGAGWSWRK